MIEPSAPPRPRQLLGALALLLAAAAAPAAPPRKVVMVSWDAGADWVVDRLLATGRLPAVARMAAGGVQADWMLAAFPSKTAVGHASLFNGCWADRHGVSGNLVPRLPRGEHSLVETSSGFASTALRTEPVYVTAARAGRRVAALSATQVYPLETHVDALHAAGVGADRFIAFSGFEHALAAPRMLGGEALAPPAPGWQHLPRHRGRQREMELEVAGTRFFALLFDDPADPVRGFDSVLVRQGHRGWGAPEAVLKPALAGSDLSHWSPPFRVRARGLLGLARFRLFSLSADGQVLELYQRSVNGLRGTPPEAETERYLEAMGGFHDDAFGGYQRGMLGPPLWQGGDGEAERRVVETARLDFELLTRGTRYALRHWQPDLLLHYTPLPDSAGHAWAGVLDPQSPAHDPVLAARLWPFYAEVFALADAWLGDLLDQVDPDTAVILVSDHGMEGSTHTFNPNAVLAAAGLLSLTRAGDVDLSRTQVFAPPGGDFHLNVNSTDWRSGIVPPGERQSIVQRATQALLTFRNGEGGPAVVTAVFDSERYGGLGLGGPTGGDLYLDVAPGYYPTPHLGAPAVERIPSPIGQGNHGFNPQRRSMHAIFYMLGAGVAPGKRIGPMAQVDVAPTMARLLGIPVAQSVTGHVLGEALTP